MTLEEYISKAREATNWNPGFFEATEPIFIRHLDTIRRTLVKDGLWEQFDEARCEWKLPGQAKVWESERKAVPDRGRFRPLKEESPAGKNKGASPSLIKTAPRKNARFCRPSVILKLLWITMSDSQEK